MRAHARPTAVVRTVCYLQTCYCNTRLSPPGQGLAAHLDVPLPYLLFRAQTRYEEDLRGLQDIRGAFNPLIPPRPTSKQGENTSDERPGLPRRDSLKTGSAIKLSSSGRIHTPLSVRARLTSMGANSSSRRTASSSTLTLRGGSLGRRARAPLRPATPPTSGSDSGESGESGDEATQAEEAERAAEEESALERKLRDLERMMTSETLGLVQSRRAHEKGKSVDRGRPGAAGSLSSTRQGLPDSFRVDNAGAESDRSQSVSSSGSPQGSIPSMPSPPSESQRSSPVSIHRHLSPSKSSSPPMVSPRSARGMRFQALVGGANPSEHGSSHGSSASSFSDISGEQRRRGFDYLLMLSQR